MTEAESVNDWERIHSSTKWEQGANTFLVQALEQINLNSSLWFLDLGCGTGSSALWLLKHGCNVVAVDISPTAIETLQRDARDIPDCGILETVVGDVVNLDATPTVANHKYDWVIDINTLMCLSLKDARAVIEGAQKYLKPNGMFFSLMLCEPFSSKFTRNHYLRLAKDKHEVKMLFAGYSLWLGKTAIFVGDPEDPTLNVSYVIRAING